MQILSIFLATSSLAYAKYANSTIAEGPAIVAKTTAKVTKTPVPTPVALPQGSSSSQELTTYITVELGKTITITTSRPKPTGIQLANGANAVAVGAAAIIAGAVHLL